MTAPNLPNACIMCTFTECDFYDTEWNRSGENEINYRTSRAVNCPLEKSNNASINNPLNKENTVA